jgi:hypothetical protein
MGNVILSEAKDLGSIAQMLRCAQHDNCDQWLKYVRTHLTIANIKRKANFGLWALLL